MALPLCTAVGAGCSSDEDRATLARERAESALAHGNRGDALAALETLTQNVDESPEAALEIASLQIRAGEAPRALWLLEEAVQRFPDRDDLRVSLAATALLLGDPARAQARLEPIGPESEFHASALVARARASLELGDLEGALEFFGEVERLHPDFPQARALRIATLLGEGRVDEARVALSELERSQASDNERTALRLARIALYEAEIARGRSQVGLTGLAGLVRDDPDDTHAWRSFVHAHLRSGEIDPALDRVREALREEPDRLTLYSFAAALHAARGEHEIAEELLEELVRRSESATARIGLAQFRARRGDGDAALALLRETAERFPDDPGVHFAHAEMLLSWGRVPQGREALTRLRGTLPPDDPRVGYLDARVTLAEGDAARAHRLLLQVIPRFDTAVTQYWLGVALEGLGNATGADRRYRAAIHHDGTLAQAHWALLRLSERRGRWREFVAHARSAVQMLPGHPEGWSALANGLLRLREIAEAEQVARTAVGRWPVEELRLLVVRALAAGGRHAEALVELERAREKHGDTPGIGSERALALGRSGRIEEALREVEATQLRSPDAARPHVVEALLRFAKSQGEQAARAIDRALALDPENPEPLRFRAEFRFANDDLAGALSDALRYIEQRSEDAQVHFLVGVIQERSRKTSEAIAAYRRAAEFDAEAFLARNNLAELLAARGEFDEALRVAQQAYRLGPESPHVLDTLGGLYLRKGRADRAITFLAEALDAQPDWQPTRLRLGLAYREIGRVEDARRLLSEVRSSRSSPAALRAQADEALRVLP